jgi:hypothetical protein
MGRHQRRTSEPPRRAGLGCGFEPLPSADNIAHSAQNFKHFLPLGGALLGYAGGLIDHDAGGYRDSFKPLPDKQAHFLASVILGKAVADGTSVRLGLATCLVSGLAWELGQSRHHGYASPYDAGFDIGGCLVGARWGRT